MSYSKKEVINIQEKLKKGNNIIDYDINELNYIRKPIGKAIYNKACEDKKELDKTIQQDEIKLKKTKKWDPNEKVICELCGNRYTKSNKAVHETTKIHIAYKNINDKFRLLLLS